MKLMNSEIKYQIESKRLFIRPISLEDINDTYIGWLNDQETNRYLETRRANRKSIIEYINNLRGLNLDLFAVFDKNRNLHIGNISITSLDENKGCYGLMIGDESSRFLGLGGEASLCVMKFLFESLGIERLEVGANIENSDACRNLLDLGFLEFSVNSSSRIFELSRSDWRTNRRTKSKLYKNIQIEFLKFN